MRWVSNRNLTTLTPTDLMSPQIKFPQDSSSEGTLSDHKAIRCLPSLQIHQRLTISAICRICHHFWWSLANRRGSSLAQEMMTSWHSWGVTEGQLCYALCWPRIQGISHVSIVLPVEYCATLQFGCLTVVKSSILYWIVHDHLNIFK